MLILFFIIPSFSFGQGTFQITIGGANNEYPSSFYQTPEGGYILAGGTYSYGAGLADVYFVEIDGVGNILWSKTYGGDKRDHSYTFLKTSDDGYLSAGRTWTYGSGGGLPDTYIIKTNNNGDTLWVRTIGGAGNSGLYSAIETPSGYTLIGNTNAFGAGFDDAYLVMLDTNGDTLQTKTFGGPSTEDARAIRQTSDGGFIIVGYSNSYTVGDYDILLMKLDAAANLVWSKTYGGAGTEYGHEIEQTTDGGYIICGQTNSFGSGGQDVYLLKTDSIGNLQWSKTYGGAADEIAYSLALTSDGGFILTGQTNSFGFGANDVYVIKTDNSGTVQWSKTYGGTSWDESFRIKEANEGGYLIFGWTDNFGAGDYDWYFIKTDAFGNSGCNDTTVTTITTNPTTSDSSHTLSVFSGSLVTKPTPNIGTGAISEVLCITTGVHEINSALGQVTIYPNPTTGIFTVQSTGEIQVYDLFGRLVLRTNKKEIDMGNYPSGIYMVRVGEATRKIILY